MSQNLLRRSYINKETIKNGSKIELGEVKIGQNSGGVKSRLTVDHDHLFLSPICNNPKFLLVKVVTVVIIYNHMQNEPFKTSS